MRTIPKPDKVYIGFSWDKAGFIKASDAVLFQESKKVAHKPYRGRDGLWWVHYRDN